MLERGNGMEGESSKRDYEGQYPASLYFDESLKQAIASGSEKDLIAALSRQGLNNVTESISNHLIVRSFLASQKGRLAALYKSVTEAESAADVVSLVGDYVDRLMIQFTDTFVTDWGGNKFAKLSGDALFREALSAPGEGLSIARNIADINLSALMPPDEIFYQMEDLEDTIAESLWTEAHDIRERGMGAEEYVTMRYIIDEQIEAVDEALQNNLPKIQKRT